MRGFPRLALVLLGGVVLSAAAEASAGGPVRYVELPGVSQLPPTPPLNPPTSLPFAPRLPLPSSVRSAATATAVARPDGTLSRLSAVQRLVIAGTGDFAFAVPAPAKDAVAARGSESAPGLRPGQVLWQGFASKHKILAARMTLRTREAAPVLPIRVRVRGVPVHPGPFALRIDVTNTTATRVPAFTATPVEADLRRAERALQRAARAGLALRPTFVRVRGPVRPAPTTVSASIDVDLVLRLPPRDARVTDIRVDGIAMAPSNTIRLSRPTGAGRPRSIRVHVRGTARRETQPSIAVWARPAERRAVTEGPADVPPARLLRRVMDGRLRYERTRQYARLLANPDPNGPSETRYLVRVRRPAQPSELSARVQGGDDLPVAVVVGLAAIGAATLLVVWAHL